MMRCLATLLAAVMLLTGCAGRAPLLAPLTSSGSLPAEAELTSTPFFPQRQYQCGPASLATVLSASGVETTPAALMPLVYLPQRQGSLQLELVAASRRQGRIPFVVAPHLTALIDEVAAGRPVLVLQNLGFDSYPLWHYAVVVGYSIDRDEVVLRSGTTARLVMPARRFLDTWRRGGHWGLVLLRPGELPADDAARRYLEVVAAAEGLLDAAALRLAYRAALARWPDDGVAWFGLAAAEHRLGDLAAAETGYRRLLRLQPTHAAARNNLAEVLADRGCLHLAEQQIEQALSLDDGPLRDTLLATRDGIRARRAAVDDAIAACRRTVVTTPAGRR